MSTIAVSDGTTFPMAVVMPGSGEEAKRGDDGQQQQQPTSCLSPPPPPRWDEDAHLALFNAIPLPPLTIADVMDCFRLYFGSNVTIFPFYAARLGAVGIIGVVCGAIGLNLLTQSSLHRARYNMSVIELRRRLSLSHRDGSKAAESFPVPIAAADAASVMMAPIVTTASSGMSGVIISGATLGSMTSHTAEEALARMASSPSAYTTSSAASSPTAPSSSSSSLSMVRYVLGPLGTLVKLSSAMWPRHWTLQAITFCTVFAQFFGLCGFVLLLANNVAPALGISDDLSVYASAIAMGLLTMDTSLSTKTLLAYANNLFILSGAFLLLYSSLAHTQTEEEAAMGLQIMPKSIAQFAMYAPSVIAYCAPHLVTLDAETVLSERIFRLHFAGSAGTSSGAAATTPSSSSFSVTVTPASNSPSSPSNNGGGKHGFGDHPDIASLGVAVALQRCFRRALYVGAGASVLILLFFAELIMFCFKDNTNAIIALSFPSSGIRTAILICLCIGLYACGVLNVGPICDVLDSVSASLKALASAHDLLRRFVARLVLFTLVVIFLYLVPFFDLVAALSSAISTPTYVFFIPAICELQSEMLKAHELKQHEEAAKEGTKGKDGEGNQRPSQSDLSIVDGWRGMPASSKMLAVVSLCLGSLILCFSTSTVIAETIRRRSEGSV